MFDPKRANWNDLANDLANWNDFVVGLEFYQFWAAQVADLSLKFWK